MMIDPARPDWPRLVPFGILAASVGALATAYTAQYAFGLEPCILCLYQRVPYALAGVLGLGALLLPNGEKEEQARAWAVAACGLVFLTGAGIAFYHVGVEQHWWVSAACGVSGGSEVPKTVEDLRQMLTEKPPKACDDVDWTLFGLTMATYNIGASLALAAAAFWGAARIRRTV